MRTRQNNLKPSNFCSRSSPFSPKRNNVSWATKKAPLLSRAFPINPGLRLTIPCPPLYSSTTKITNTLLTRAFFAVGVSKEKITSTSRGIDTYRTSQKNDHRYNTTYYATLQRMTSDVGRTGVHRDGFREEEELGLRLQEENSTGHTGTKKPACKECEQNEKPKSYRRGVALTNELVGFFTR